MAVTTIENKEFTSRCLKVLGDREGAAITDYLSENPKAGEAIKATGGIRKISWPIGAKNKSETKAVVYYYYKDRTTPVYLIAVFRPGVKQALAKVIEMVVTR